MQKQSLNTKIEQFVIDKVKEIRRKKKISQLQLSSLLGLSPGFISDVESENRRAKYNINHLNKLSRVLNCKFHEFFPSEPFGDEEPESKS